LNIAATLNPELEALTAGLPEEVCMALRGLFGGLENKIGGLQRKVSDLEILIRMREEQLRMARVEKYGPRSEKLSPSQIMLLDLEPGVQIAEVEGEAARPADEKQVADAAKPAGTDTPPRKKRAAYSKVHPGRTPLPADLPRQEVIIPCEEAPGGALVGYEIREELVIKPAEFYVQVLKREKRLVVIADRRTIITAPLPLRILEKSQFEDSVIVELLVRKYCDHLPAYRQRMIWERDHGLIVNDALLIRSILKAGELLQPLARAIGEELKNGDLIQADETRVPVLQQEGKGRNDTAWFWQYSAPGGLIFFDYQDSRSRAGPKAFLRGYTRTLQSDGYEVYVNLVEEICAHAGCWAHVRRKFDTARKVAPKDVPCRDSQEILDGIAFLYRVENEARTAGLDVAARLRHRQERGIVNALEDLKKKIIGIRTRALPASQLGKACDYALGQWENLMVYTRDGRVEIDNNWCENAIRPIALGRKNWMHLGSRESGPKVAAIMTVIASAQRLGLNVRDYLGAVLPKLADPEFKTGALPELLPTRWKPQKQSA
jgi:transposase